MTTTTICAMALSILSGVDDDPALSLDRISIDHEPWQMRIEIGAYGHYFDSALDLAGAYGLFTQVSFNVFERLWVFGEFRHLTTVFEVPGPNPEDPKIDVDTWIVGIAGHRPVTDYSWVAIHLGAGRQRIDVGGGGPMEEEAVAIAGVSLVASEQSWHARVGGEVEYTRTAFNQPGGAKATALNYVAYLSLGVQF
jgi:hypothetical protein